MTPKRAWVLTMLTWVLAWIPPAAAGQPGLRPFEAEYQLRRDSVVFGKMLLSLSISETGDYLYQASTLATGLAAVLRSDQITELSEGRIRGDSVVPERYLYHHQRAEKPRHITLDFDWQSQRVTNHAAGEHWTMPIMENTQDKFSQQLALMLQAQQGAEQIEFPVADGGRLKNYRYDHKGLATLETPVGIFPALRLDRRKDARPSQSSIWLAPEMNFLPLKIERRGDSGVVRMELLSVDWKD